jgi:hypothetical protein
MSKAIAAYSSGVPFGGTSGLRDFIAPRITDVLFGRGGGGRYHLGTRAYRYLVKRNQASYCTCSERKKRFISKSIVLALRKQGRRFLTLSSKDNAWCEIDIDKAVTKTSQSLREGQPRRRQDLTFKHKVGNQALRQPVVGSSGQSMLTSTKKQAATVASQLQVFHPADFPGTIQDRSDRTGSVSTGLDRCSTTYGVKSDLVDEDTGDRRDSSSSDSSENFKTGLSRSSKTAAEKAGPVLSSTHRPPPIDTKEVIDAKKKLLPQNRSAGAEVAYQRKATHLNSTGSSFGTAAAEVNMTAIGEFIRRASPLSTNENSTATMLSVSNTQLDPALQFGAESDSENEGHVNIGGLNALVAPLNSDVLFGRGGGGQYHPGTQAYRYLVRHNQPQYCICTERQKRNIAKNIVESLRDQGRRFLSRNKMGTWYDIGNDEAIKKTSQA